MEGMFIGFNIIDEISDLVTNELYNKYVNIRIRDYTIGCTIDTINNLAKYQYLFYNPSLNIHKLKSEEPVIN